MRFLGRIAMGALALCLVPGAAHAEWWEATTGRFVVYSESSEADAKRFASQMDRVDGALRELQGMPPAGELSRSAKVTVFRTGEPSYIGGLLGSGSVYGFYIPRAGRPVAFAPAQDEKQRGSRHYESKVGQLSRSVVLNHEYTHHFLLKNFPATYPGWYVEGYAELIGMIDFKDDGSFHLGNAPEHRAAEIFQLQYIPLENLFDRKYRMRGLDWIQQYGQGWLLTHYMFFNKERAVQFDAYLAAIRKGEDSLTAAKRIFGDFKKLDAELRKYPSRNLPGLVFKPKNYMPPAVKMRALTKEEASLMRQRIQLSRGVTRKQAETILGQLRGMGPWTSDHALAQLLIAEAALDSEKFAEAAAAADRALTLDPKSIDAHIFKARALSEAGDDAGMGDKSRHAKARALLIKARKLDETNPEPLIHYYKTYLNSGEPLTEQATLALEAAFPEAAFDRNYRMLLGSQLLAESRLPEAKTVLMPIMFSAHALDEEKEPIAKLANALEDDNLAAAKTAMEELEAKVEADRKKAK